MNQSVGLLYQPLEFSSWATWHFRSSNIQGRYDKVKKNAQITVLYICVFGSILKYMNYYLPVACDLICFYYVGFEVVMAMAMKNMVFWFVMLCSSVEAHWHFGGTYHLHLKNQQVHQAINQKKQVASSFWLISWSWK